MNMKNSKTSKVNSKATDLTQRNRRARRYWTAATVFAVFLMSATPVFAAGSDPLTIVNNLSDFIFSIIKALGVIILGWGIVQVGMSIQSHDASQRTQGFLCLFGGLLIAFEKEILTSIGAV
ncbi:MAG: glutamyl-tRNA amidotransferase [Ruminococcus sp.]|nr:glutamyl-tRNA amidotransferase [Ruminococcus sp.]